MPIQALKPYVYLDESTSTKKISVYVYCKSFSISASQTIQNDTLIITCNVNTITPHSLEGPRPATLISGSYSKVRVETKSGNTLLGSTTVRVNAGDFTIYPTYPYKPHVYLKTPTAASELYVIVDTTATNKSLNTNGDTLLEQSQHKMTVYFDENGTGGGMFHLEAQNPDASTYNFVEVQVRNNLKVKKGGGKTDQEDGDSSGNN